MNLKSEFVVNIDIFPVGPINERVTSRRKRSK
jgi:hypothetical protein